MVLTVSVLETFLQVLSKNSIWHFDVAWLLFQQFNSRDLRPVPFLVILKFIFNLNDKESSNCETLKSKKYRLTYEPYYIWHPNLYLTVMNYCCKELHVTYNMVQLIIWSFPKERTNVLWWGICKRTVTTLTLTVIVKATPDVNPYEQIDDM